MKLYYTRNSVKLAELFFSVLLMTYKTKLIILQARAYTMAHNVWCNQFHQQNFMKLYQYTQLEVTPNFYSEHSAPYASKFNVNLHTCVKATIKMMVKLAPGNIVEDTKIHLSVYSKCSICWLVEKFLIVSFNILTRNLCNWKQPYESNLILKLINQS